MLILQPQRHSYEPFFGQQTATQQQRFNVRRAVGRLDNALPSSSVLVDTVLSYYFVWPRCLYARLGFGVRD